jgi:hypothetical protein
LTGISLGWFTAAQTKVTPFASLTLPLKRKT